MKRLVIIAPNWLGDAVMAQPAIADLRRALPATRIAVAARPGLTSFFGLMPEVDETVSVATLGGKEFEAALLLPNSFRSALLAFRAGIPERWGYRTEWRGLLLTRGIDTTSGLHQVDEYRHLVDALGFPNGAREPRIVVPDSMRDAGAAQLRDAGWDGKTPLVAVAPGAAYGGAKRWPAASFAELAIDLAKDGIQTVLVGGAGDVETGRTVREAIARTGALSATVASPVLDLPVLDLPILDLPILDLIAQNDIPGMAGVLVHCRAVVSNDSGAMHLGAAVGIPVTVPFGPTDERRTRPLGDGHTVLTHQVWCRPCMLRECPIDHRCMTGISPRSVADAARHSL